MPRAIVASIEAEYRRHKRMGERAMDQLDAEQLRRQPMAESLSVATIVWHVSGNLESRFTDFLTSDGEKPWREREDEFAVRRAEPAEIRAKWERGWRVLLDALAELTDADLGQAITIRGVPLTVAEALHRSLAHTCYHVGQMTYLGKMWAGPAWEYLSIPPGGTVPYDPDATHGEGPAG